jgi:hypothetical protein
MAIKISELTAATSVAGTEVLPIVQSSTTKKVEISKLKGYRSFVGLFRYDLVNDEIDLTTLQNDGFSINTTKIGTGVYNLEDTSSPFVQNKTFLLINQDNNNDGGGDYTYIMNTIFREDSDNIRIKVNDISLSSNTVYYTDNINYCSFEIRVYP